MLRKKNAGRSVELPEKRYLDDRIVFSFSEFEQGLQKTRFAPVDIKKLLEIYFGKTLVSRGEQEKEEQIRQSITGGGSQDLT